VRIASRLQRCAGVTAAFNLNVLARANRELDARFDLSQFQHRAFYNETAGRVEMHLMSRRRQVVPVSGKKFFFAEGESIITEYSYNTVALNSANWPRGPAGRCANVGRMKMTGSGCTISCHRRRRHIDETVI